MSESSVFEQHLLFLSLSHEHIIPFFLLVDGASRAAMLWEKYHEEDETNTVRRVIII